MTSNECNISSDCTDSVTGVIKLCYSKAAFSDEVFFCDCTPWYGWVGDNCDVATGQNVYYFILLITISIWSLFIQIAVGRTMFYHFKYGKRNTRWDPIVVTSCMIFVSAFLYMIHSIFTSTAITDHERFEIAEYPTLDGSTVEDVTVTGGKALGYLLLIGASGNSLASLQIFSSWQHIAIEAARFGAERTKLVAANTLNGIRIFIVVFIIFLVLGISLDQLVLSVLIVTVTAFVLAIGYPIAYMILKKTFLGLKVDGNVYVQQMIATIKYCCLVNAISLFISGIFLTIFFALLVFFDEILTPGKFNFVVFFRDLALLSSLYQATVMAWYVNTVANRGMKLRAGQGVWRSWDSQHAKLATSNTNQISNA